MSIMNYFFYIIPIGIFILGIIIFWVGAFFLIYHLIRFGVGTKPKNAAFIFVMGSIVLTIFVVMFFAQVNYKDLISELAKSWLLP